MLQLVFATVAAMAGVQANMILTPCRDARHLLVLKADQQVDLRAAEGYKFGFSWP